MSIRVKTNFSLMMAQTRFQLYCLRLLALFTKVKMNDEDRMLVLTEVEVKVIGIKMKISIIITEMSLMSLDLKIIMRPLGTIDSKLSTYRKLSFLQMTSQCG